MNTTDVLADLAANRAPLTDLNPPPLPGVYAFYLRNPGALGRLTTRPDELLYIGKTTNLKERGETHAANGGNGFSTVRRSLGALLIDELGLRPRPRGAAASPKDFTSYRFDPPGEQRLAAWMREHLTGASYCHLKPGDLEAALIAAACPPLNIDQPMKAQALPSWRPNPHAPALSAARKHCATLAQRATP